MPGLAGFPKQLLLSHRLSGDSRMVSARQKQSLIALHASVPDEGVFDGDGQGVADVEVAGHIGRREADDEFFGVGGLVVGVEEFAELDKGYFCYHQAFQWLSTLAGL